MLYTVERVARFTHAPSPHVTFICTHLLRLPQFASYWLVLSGYLTTTCEVEAFLPLTPLTVNISA
jgi:hypothetical protein